MVAQPHEATGRHNALLDAGRKIADLERDLEAMTIARNANRIRAERAELLVRQLQSQIASPKREAKTIYTKMKLDADRAKHDAEVAKLMSDGWTFVCDGTVLVADPVERYTTFSRTAPLEPATDQPPITAAATVTEGNACGIQESLTVDDVSTDSPRTEGEGQGARVLNSAPSSISGLWNALYAMDRFAELVQHWPRLPEYAPRVYAVFEAAGCDMTDVVIMKSFRFGHREDQWTLKVIFPKSTQIQAGTRTALVAAGFGTVIQRDGREFIFDLPQAWVSPRKTITASSMTIMTEGNAPGTDDAAAPAADDVDTDLNQALRETYEKAVAANPLPRYTSIPTYNPNGGL